VINADHPNRVYLIGGDQFAEMILTGGTMHLKEYREYHSQDAMLDDGWVID
jgi:hypothetical protein